MLLDLLKVAYDQMNHGQRQIAFGRYDDVLPVNNRPVSATEIRMDVRHKTSFSNRQN